MSPTKQCLHLLLTTLLLLSSIASNIDPYKILNVPKHATQKEIRKAFKTAALKYHPDRNLPSSDPDKMAKIASAYEILGDPSRRTEYDEKIRQDQIYAAHGFRTRSSSTTTSGGIGAQLTTFNYYNLLHNINDRPWLILVCHSMPHHPHHLTTHPIPRHTRISPKHANRQKPSSKKHALNSREWHVVLN